MKLRILFLALLTALLGASVALAHDGPGKGKPDATGPNCKPKVGFVLKGTLLSLDPATNSFHMDITHANRHGRALGAEHEILVDAKTRFRRDGEAASLASLQVGDRLKVKARGCKRADPASLELLAKRVRARSAPAAAPSGQPEAG